MEESGWVRNPKTARERQWSARRANEYQTQAVPKMLKGMENVTRNPVTGPDSPFRLRPEKKRKRKPGEPYAAGDL